MKTAKALYEKGAHVIFACRDLGKAQSAVDKIEKAANSGKIDLAVLDLSSLTSVKGFSEKTRGNCRRIYGCSFSLNHIRSHKYLQTKRRSISFSMILLFYYTATVEIMLM